MSKNHSNSSIEHGKPNSRFPQKIILYVEGRNTEPSYFDLLKRSNCTTIPVTVRGHGVGLCVDFVDEANGKYNSLSKKDKSKYKQKWIVFDCDGHDDFSDAIKKAKEYGFRVAFSNMCVEYWFMLHFYDHDGAPIPMSGDSHSQAQIDEINRFIKRYNREKGANVKLYDSDSKKVEDDLFDLMLAIDPITHHRRIEDACHRAEIIHQGKKEIGAEYRESVTTMYELMVELGVVRRIELNNGEYKYELNK